ncbi:transmembrane protein, putative (macronuclear) [Tetrahymena thermophila SB210]|uniref:Transmembrane protein, putative n=1 Tax=Tetrahymena thermophila (strain SB210) TaxID=312017 RepID=W7XC80_TETTS|nr:transmembrane protein, putative [Tetrahymena thermophila SB210]EWS71321.1 transmembrane protein, putative [Tetrahymena thermophila SB210]|eukprot:XP_012656139.1 transmembrane protein, putative [Tetrahymena thermophila SB210]
MTPPMRNVIEGSKNIVQNISKDGIKQAIKGQIQTIAKIGTKDLFLSSLKSQFSKFTLAIHLGLSLFELFSIVKEYQKNKSQDNAIIDVLQSKLKYQLCAYGVKVSSTYLVQGSITTACTVIGSLICPGIGTVIGSLLGCLLSFF